MLREVPERSLAQKDGASAGHPQRGKRARRKLRVRAERTFQRHHHVFFSMSDQLRYQRHIAVDQGRLTLAGPEDLRINTQLIDRFSSYDQTLLDLLRIW